MPSCAAGKGSPRACIKLVKEFLEAGKKRLTGDTARAGLLGEVKDLRREMRDLKETLPKMLENRLLKKSMTGEGSQESGRACSGSPRPHRMHG